MPLFREAALILSGRRQVYYGWWLVLAAFGGCGLISGLFLWSFGLYIDPIEEKFGWSRAEVSLGISIALLASGLASPLVGKLTDRRGPRFTLLLGGVVYAGGLALLATTNALWQWYLFLGVVGVSLAMTLFLAFPVLISRWFERRQGVALGAMGVGISVGGLVVVPVVRVLIDALGWETTLLISAGVVLVYFLPIVLLVVRDSPPAGRQTGRGAPSPAEEASALALIGPPLTVAIRTPVFWVLALALALFFFSTFGLVVHSVPLFESRGISTTWATGLLSLMAGISILTRIGLAAVADRARGFEMICLIVTGCGVITNALLLSSTSVGVLAGFLIVWSIADGGPSLVEPLAVTHTFGMAHFATILGSIAVIRTAVMLTSTTIAGAIFDATDSYNWALVMWISTYAASFVLFGLAMRLPRPWFRAPAAVPAPDLVRSGAGPR